MNNTKFMQTDSRWGGLVYPIKPCYIRNVGCGEVSVANIIIEMQQYANYNPATIQPYCKQFGAPNCNGTYFSGIPKMMKHYELTEVKECDTMSELWKELAKGDRVAIYLMGSRRGGSKGVHWTSGGHLVCSVGYKYENGKHYVYMKDSYSSSSLRNGWISYEENMRNDVVKVWVGKLNQKKVEPSKPGKLAVDGVGGTNTIKAMQKYFGVTQDGYLGDQLKKLNVYYPSITAVKYGNGKSGSQTVKALQKWLKLTQDGVIGQGTTAAWQKRLRDLGYLAKNETIDGIFGVKSMKAWQRFLNDELFKEEDKKPDPTPTPTPTPTPSAKAPYKVIDVSDHQRQIDWNKVKADGVIGAIIRYADGDTLDVRFSENMINAKKAGLHIGAYIFSRAKTKAQAEDEAIRLFNACKPYDLDLPLYIDLEAKGLEKYANTVAQAFIAKIKAFGGKPGVYANLNWWNNYLQPTAKMSFAMWVAQYNSTLDYKPRADVGMWQYSSRGKVNGINGRVDMDWLYVPYWETIKTERIMDACKTQAEWMKNSKYKWQANPTIEKSKTYGTCVTYVACVLQRLGYLAPGKCIWHNKEGKALGTTDRMEVIYPNGKILSQLKGELKAGDIVMDGDKTNLESGSHIFIVTGKWSGSKPIIWDNHSAQGKGGKSYTYSRDRNVIAIVRLK